MKHRSIVLSTKSIGSNGFSADREIERAFEIANLRQWLREFAGFLYGDINAILTIFCCSDEDFQH